ncbi:MAG: hypothetical protein HC902_05210 [Calothrix sp. SM1_5_4]|nr:hypothetical protein [Calothrix sp. SM1_5_4]
MPAVGFRPSRVRVRGAGACATWLSNRVLGLGPEGYGRILHKGLLAREKMAAALRSVPDILLAEPSDLNLVGFCLAKPGESLSEVNRRTSGLVAHFESCPGFSVSRTSLGLVSHGRLLRALAKERGIRLNEDDWVLIRLVLMNPFLVSREMSVDIIAEFVLELRAAAAKVG